MSQNITLLGASYSDVPAVDLPKTGGGTARFTDTTDANATASDIAEGKTAYVNNVKVVGTASGGGGGYTWDEKYNGSAYIVSDNPNYISITNFSEAFGADETWRVTWGSGGTAYVCETKVDSMGTTYDGYYIGNPGVVGGTDDGSGCPFIAYKRSATQLVFATNQSSGSIHLIIEKQTSSQGSAKNVQIAQSVNRVATTTYTAVSGQTLTVAETGKYDVYWSGYRSSTSGTSGSQLYIDDTAYGSANTTFSNHGQSVHLSNVSLTKNQVIEVRARARNTSSYMYVGNLTIIQN